jgi:hypothetical protein
MAAARQGRTTLAAARAAASERGSTQTTRRTPSGEKGGAWGSACGARRRSVASASVVGMSSAAGSARCQPPASAPAGAAGGSVVSALMQLARHCSSCEGAAGPMQSEDGVVAMPKARGAASATRTAASRTRTPARRMRTKPPFIVLEYGCDGVCMQGGARRGVRDPRSAAEPERGEGDRGRLRRMWRRGGDSNPRGRLPPPTRFPVVLLKPTRTPLRAAVLACGADAQYTPAAASGQPSPGRRAPPATSGRTILGAICAPGRTRAGRPRRRRPARRW